MIKNWSFTLNYGHFEKKFKSVIVFQNHYLNKIFDVYPLSNLQISNSPIGPTKNLEWLYNWVVVRSLIWLFATHISCVVPTPRSKARATALSHFLLCP